jgi:hypothetical protein
VALTYGPDADWVKNVLTAGEAELHTRGRRMHLRGPYIYHDESRHETRRIERPVLRLLGVADFLAFRG